MKIAGTAAAALVLAGCASSSIGDRPIPALFDYEYEFSGQLEGTSVSGRMSFERDANGELRYTIHSDRGSTPCRGYVRSPASARVRLSCHGLQLQFTNGGEVATQSFATLHTSRLVSREECVEWRVDQKTGRRTCAAWHTVSVEQPVTHSGAIDIRRVNGD
ncbi:MAG TPA: hypothetical protein VHG09_12320 [Longimicrobiales bacterium]|nr:hypothetical protein [Longimicrobiales bacterium]